MKGKGTNKTPTPARHRDNTTPTHSIQQEEEELAIMPNPITAWIKSGMETYTAREEWMEERVSENSINAQKLSDERHGPFKPHNSWQNESRASVNFRPAAANSGVAGQAGGYAGSYQAFRYYQNGYAQRRDEILTEIAKNGE